MKKIKMICGAAIIALLPLQALAGEKMILDDFSAASAQRWSYVADTVMGGVSEGAAQIRRDGDTDYVQLKGTVSTDNNGGFIQVRRRVDGLPEDLVGISVTARGNGETYYVFLRSRNATRPWHSYRATFVAGQDWTETRLNITDFKPSRSELPAKIAPSDITGIGLVAYGKDFDADLDVAKISAF